MTDQPCAHSNTVEKGMWIGPHQGIPELGPHEVQYTKRCKKCGLVITERLPRLMQ